MYSINIYINCNIGKYSNWLILVDMYYTCYSIMLVTYLMQGHVLQAQPCTHPLLLRLHVCAGEKEVANA